MISTAEYLNYKTLDSSTLLAWLDGTIQTTTQNIASLSEEHWQVPMLDSVNPPAWELGHLIWFHEFWVHRRGNNNAASIIDNADALFNSSIIAHADRWTVQLPSTEQLMRYFEHVIEATRDLLNRDCLDNQQRYFLELSIYHQDMHNEAFAYMCQMLHYPYWDRTALPNVTSIKLSGSSMYKEFSAQTLMVGSISQQGFLFDNEKWQFAHHLKPFAIARQPVTNQQYLQFITESDGNVKPPQYWKHENQTWYQREFDSYVELVPNEPVKHISYQEALAYCNWSKVRLPTEFELLALLQSENQSWVPSHLWEWSSSIFSPFPGFSPDPYVDYSAPWFNGRYQVLKGYSPYTPERLRRTQFRNFYQPSRNDIFSGFRTCLPEI